MRNLVVIFTFFIGITIAGVACAAPVSNVHPGSQGMVDYEVGSIAPPFTLDAVVNQEFKKISLGDYKGKWVVLFFYPADFTFVCPTEIKGFNKSLAEFSKANAEVLAISVDSKYSHLAWIKSGALDNIEYPLLSDFSKQISRSYAVLDMETSTARRGLFIIDPNGVIQYRVVHSDKVGRSVDETLRVLKALQTEELCPINWKPGEKTIPK
jgi:peroxiredoxin (alkyl hydroperoxide reductase subunit C)